MRHHYRKTAQLELFNPSEESSLHPVPRWQNLPDCARGQATDLLVQLLLEHEPDGTCNTPRQSREKADV